MNYQQFCDSFLTSLKNKFVLHLDEKSSNNEKVCLRSTISSGTEAENFVKTFSEITDTKWIVVSNHSAFIKVAYRKNWLCHLSSHRKTSLSDRNFKCNSKISITVKKMTKITIQRDPYLSAAIPLCCVIIIDLNHTHPLYSADILRKLWVSDEVQKQFFSYFDDGLSPMTAKRCHENIILMSESYLTDLANAAKNPTSRQVYYLYTKWREINLGPVCNPFEKLLQKNHLYQEKGATLYLDCDGTWAVLIVTALMKRVHSLTSSSEIVFLDTTASCEGTNSSLTIMLVPTKAGAIPIAVFLHENQTTDSYIKAFSMLKMHFPCCFGGKEFPAVFMTDDSKAEKKALSTLWGNSVQLLCHFHVAQAEWRWIHSSKEIPQQTKPVIMKHFQSIMYATSEKDLVESYTKLLLFAAAYTSYVNRLKQHFQRRAEWTLFDRQHLIIRGHNTNNFAESTIRIIKDIVLCRTKAFNVVALTDFIVNTWEKFLCLKLIDYANSRHDSSLSLRMNKTYNVPFEECIQISPQLFSLPSMSKQNVMYEVNVDVGHCTCQRGKTGAFCKHQCFLYRKLGIGLPNVPTLSAADKLELVFLASGSRNLNAEFYKKSSEVDVPTLNDDVLYESTDISNSSIVPPVNNAEASVEKKLELIKEFKEMLMAPQSSTMVDRLIATFKTKKTPETKKNCLTTMALAVSTKNYKRSKEKKIKCQPTSISRRIPRGTNAIYQRVLNKKRKHKLSKNINQNIPNPK